ncbi:hypothetical protein FA15DRAFT_83430 [Coprinopsis marcescibilis]|uniref:Fungal-type protein kinase domain-containing protein n=1 Tax=Coprinopsis marcescibilis TaxID=230819 RepID=A0A5C3KN88_COPMA|nr:hypothetical protein FA15DRAFT_83430 [Coprinopsis marcescibilis]
MLDTAISIPHIEQVGVRARDIYSQQPTRDFVRSLVISERRVRLLQYDRSGAKYSDPFDFHLEAARFVKLVLGLTSDDPRLVGFDKSICWEVYKGTKDVHGKINAVDAKGDKITYDIVGDRPSFHRCSLIGRATNTWDVTGPNGEEYIVKDLWREARRSSEPDLLEAAKGVVGVAQMIACEDIYKVSDFRDLQDGEELTDRTKCRITLERYGRQIEHFQSASQALWALHDAISAHKELFKAGVLHRDISKNNILFGRPDAEPGWRGVLIDMDMSIFVDLAKRDNAADFRTGTRMFQSISVLTSFNSKVPMAQDFYDDIESFFYVLCYLLFVCESKGKQYRILPMPQERTLRVKIHWRHFRGVCIGLLGRALQESSPGIPQYYPLPCQIEGKDTPQRPKGEVDRGPESRVA